MDFDLSEEQRLLKDSLSRLLDKHYDHGQRRRYMAEPDGWSRAMWRRYADLGLLALPFAEADGGIGGSAVETLIVMEAFGRGLILEPYLATIVLGGGLIALGGSSDQRKTLIPQIADGSLLLAFAQAERQSRYDLFDVATSARETEDGWIVNGAKTTVLHGDCADKVILSARLSGERRDRDGIVLFLVDADAPGITRRAYATQDRLRAADMAFRDVRIGPDALIGLPGAALPLIEHVVDGAIAALCAEAVGAMECAQEMTIDYLKTRSQFGRVIGNFQALQHRAVDMLMMVEQARGMALFAAMMDADTDPVDRLRAVSAAKVQIGDAARFVGEQSIQLHGGIGLTDDYRIGHIHRRLAIIGLLFGDAGHHLGRLADAGGLI